MMVFGLDSRLFKNVVVTNWQFIAHPGVRFCLRNDKEVGSLQVDCCIYMSNLARVNYTIRIKHKDRQCACLKRHCQCGLTQANIMSSKDKDKPLFLCDHDFEYPVWAPLAEFSSWHIYLQQSHVWL